MKRCSICGADKPRSEFYARRRSPDGLQAHCRECSRRTIDAAEARRRQPRPIAATYGELAAVFAARADEVVEALVESAGEGSLHPLADLADALEPACPAYAPAGGDSPGPRPMCALHFLAAVHEANLAVDYPPVYAAIEAEPDTPDQPCAVDEAATDAPDSAESAEGAVPPTPA
jgi:hypothetical protein